MLNHSTVYHELLTKIENRTAQVGVIGLGYVGLPLAARSGRVGFRVIGFDIVKDIVNTINSGESYVDDVPSEVISNLREQGRLEATTDFRRVRSCDIVVICVPTPLNKTRDPDMSYIEDAAENIARALRTGQ